MKAVAIHSWMLKMEPPKGVNAFLKASNELASSPWTQTAAVHLRSFAVEDDPALIQAMMEWLPPQSLDATDYDNASF